MESTNSSHIKSILDSINGSENKPIPQIIASLFAIFTALVVAYLMEPWRRSFMKTNLVPIKVVSQLQGGTYCYRLAIENDSHYIAKNVEIDLEEIKDDGNITRQNLIPSPLSWTHRSRESRDIQPHQTVYLNLLEAIQEQNKFLRITAPNIQHLDDMTLIKPGESKLTLKVYQDNGQIKQITIKVTWNGNESFEEADLPEIKIA